MSSMATQLSNNLVANEQAKPNDEEEEIVASNEAPSTGHVVNMYQCTRTAQKTTTEKEPPSDGPALKQNNQYNLRSQGVPTVFEIPRDKIRPDMLRTVSPLVNSTKKTQSKSGKTTTAKSVSTSTEDKSSPPETTNSIPPPDTSVSLPTLD